MSEETTNQRIGDYQILNELGSGGMGRVYRVRNVISDRIEAMKILLPDLAGRQELAARFLREIKLMAALNHPNIAALRTAFTFENQLVMIMEYVEGKTVASILEHGPIPPADAVNYIEQVLSALSYAHQQHVIHRDIKPANMMLTPQGVIKLMDFGIARAGDEHTLTMTGTTLGSLGYMSPEQVKGEATDARSDLYSVGVSLYEMLTGQRPFRAESDYSIMTAHVKEMPKPLTDLEPGLPTALNDIIFMAIAKDPNKRFQSADAFRNALSTVKLAPAAAPAAQPVQHSEATTVDIPAPAAAAPVVAVAPPPTPTPMPPPVSAPAPAKVVAPPTPPMPVPPPQTSTGHRGLYMTLGALIVLAGLAIAGVYLPRHRKTSAAVLKPESSISETPNTTAKNETPQAPASAPSSAQPEQLNPTSAAGQASPMSEAGQASLAQTHPAEAPAAAAPANTQPAQLGSLAGKPAAAHLAKPSATKSALPALPAGIAAAVDSQKIQDDSAELDELEQQVDQLSNRAAAVNSSLDRLQQEQSAAGYGLRGDIVSRQASMKTNLSRAQDAVERGDVERAKKYVKQAESDVEVLERFLGH
jgi:serine/threonine protein kinase